jgi:hypothetical protein
MSDNMKRYGGPYDRGSADRFYGRPFKPHYYIQSQRKLSSSPILVTDEYMTEEQRREYELGWNEETDRKDY